MLGDDVFDKFPWLPGMVPWQVTARVILNRTWRRCLSITGADGLPPLSNAGNVLRPSTAVKAEPAFAAHALIPGARVKCQAGADQGSAVRRVVEFEVERSHRSGTHRRLRRAGNGHDHASQEFFGRPAMYLGEGGTIPFMGMLGEKIPTARSRHHRRPRPAFQCTGPNEFPAYPDRQASYRRGRGVLSSNSRPATNGLTRGSAAMCRDLEFGAHGCC